MSTVEIKDSTKTKISKKLKCICIVCKKRLSAIGGLTDSNAEQYPSIAGGVVFRSSGQYGSAVLDCGVGIPPDWGTEIQIIVCDDCIESNAEIINASRNKRAVIERRPFADVAVNWSDYATFAELLKARHKNDRGRRDLFDKMMKNHETRKFNRNRKKKAKK